MHHFKRVLTLWLPPFSRMSEKASRMEARDERSPSNEDHGCVNHTMAQTAVIWRQNREWWQKIHFRFVHGF